MTVDIHFEGPVDEVMREMRKVLQGSEEWQHVQSPRLNLLDDASERTDAQKYAVDHTPEPATSTVSDTKTVDTNVPTDADGFPWDERIHVSTKTQKKGDGCWKRIPGVDPKLVAEVEAELRQHFPKPEAGSAPEEADAADEPTDDAETQAADAADEAAENAHEGLTLDDVRNAMQRYIKVHGMAAATSGIGAILKPVTGVSKIVDIPADKIAEAIAAIDAAINATDETAPTATKADLMTALKAYGAEFGSSELNADGRKILSGTFGEHVTKFKEVPKDDSARIAATIEVVNGCVALGARFGV
jgi:hypothetical protein